MYDVYYILMDLDGNCLHLEFEGCGQVLCLLRLRCLRGIFLTGIIE